MSQHYARGRVEQPFQGYPTYGALHEIYPDTDLRKFLADVSGIIDGVLGLAPIAELEEEPVVIDPAPHFQPQEDFGSVEIGPFEDAEPIAERYDSRKYYRLFDPEKMGVPVVEALAVQKAAQAMRILFESQDFGAIEQDARNEINRRQPSLHPVLLFNRVEGTGKILSRSHGVVPERGVRQKLALVADVSVDDDKVQATIEQLDFEFQIITFAIAKRLKQYVIPTDYIKSMTFAVLKSTISVGQFAEIMKAINDRLASQPLLIDLERDLTFRPNAKRRSKARK